MPKVSIIIPCYNTQKYIGECIDSLLSQTLTDFEIICVDDGSSDETLSILNRYSIEDSRIKVLEQKNQYAGVARNKGLAAAEGEYVIFLDSDDFFSENMLEKAVSAADENSAEVVVFGFRRFDNKTKELASKKELPNKKLIPEGNVFSAKDVPDDIFRITSPAPWTKLFRRAFIEKTGLEFQALPNSNDFFFVLSALSMAEKICAVYEDFTFYRVNMTESIQGSKHKNPLCFLEAIEALYEQLNKNGTYELFEKAFCTIALSSSSYNLTSAATDETRYKIIEALGNENGIIFKFLNKEAEYYVCEAAVKHATTIRNAVAQYNKVKSLKKKADTQQVVAYRGNGNIGVSVVIPVYNTGEYLYQTVESISEQTLREIEIICINDGSTDNSLDILKLWAQKDERISVWTQENAGLSCTRNAGINIAKGKYIYFMDGDDLLEKDALEVLYQKAESDKLDVIYFDADVICSNLELEAEADKYNYRRKKSYDEVYRGQDLFTLLYRNSEYLASACLQMLRKDYVIENGFDFHPGIIHEDNAFTFAAIINAERVSHINRAFFHRRIRDNSIMTSSVSFKNAYGYYVSFIDMMRAYNKAEHNISPENKAAATARIGLNLFNAYIAYATMPKQELGCEYGLGEDMQSFIRLVVRPGDAYRRSATLKESEAKLKKAKKKLTANNKKLTKKLEAVTADYDMLNKKYEALEKTNSKTRRKKWHKFVLCCWENGYLYTVKRYTRAALKKLTGKK